MAATADRDIDDMRKRGPDVGTSGMVAAENWDDWTPGPYSAFPSRKQRTYEYNLMAHKDPTVRTSLMITQFMLLNKLGEYSNENKQVQERVRDLLQKIDGGMRHVCQQLLSALWAGYAVLEKTWETGASEWYVRECELLHPLTFFATNKDTEGIVLDPVAKKVTQVVQYEHAKDGQWSDVSVTIPIDRVLYWPLLREAREDTYGNSLLEGARRAWFSKVREENYWNTFAEKCACPTPVFWVPHTTVTNALGESQPISQVLMETYETVRPGEAIAIPIDSDMPYKMEMLVPTGDGEAFERICRYWDSQLFKAILTPRLLVEEPEHSSRAQSETNLDLFVMTLDGIRVEMGEVLIHQLIKPLIFYNIGPQDDYGEWAFEPLSDKDLERLAAIFERLERGKASAAMTTGGFSPADDAKLRETFGEDLYATPEEVQAAEAERIAQIRKEQELKREAMPEQMRLPVDGDEGAQEGDGLNGRANGGMIDAE
ncbi:MAG: hypothetical protein WC977_04465 [Anaerovoracaceae bacterium]